MSSSIAMNRRISRNNGDTQNVSFDTGEEKEPHKLLDGTPIQQCWKILNFHETRLNRVDQFILGKNKVDTANNEALKEVRAQIDELKKRLADVETINVGLSDEIKKLHTLKPSPTSTPSTNTSSISAILSASQNATHS